MDADEYENFYRDKIEKLKYNWNQIFSGEIPERTIWITPINIPSPRQRYYVR